ncbi:MAG: KAP family NTPase [Methanoregula sp.]|jgi:hypothetical protein|nr:KAP family NTPase [Methanoregula sp.]
MKTLLQNNYLKILINLLWGELIFYLSIKYIEIISYYLIEYKIEIFALISILLLLYWHKFNFIFYRYKNNYKNTELPFTILDSLSLIIFSFTLLILFSLWFENIREIFFTKLNYYIYPAVAIFIWFLAAYYYKFNKEKHESTDYKELSDEPIPDIEHDLLNRERFIKGLHQEIISANYQDSFVFGLYGKWGEGKTSVLNLLKNYIATDRDNTCIVVNYDPWYFKDNEAVLAGFYAAINIAVNNIYFLPNFKTLIYRYGKILSLGVSYVGLNLSLNGGTDVEDIKNSIEKCLIKIGKRMIIFIDNIDRLQKDEILKIFSLIKLTANFKNITYFLSFDIAIVKKIIRSEFDEDNYIEKIIQKPIPLPAIYQENIDKFLDKHLDRIFNELPFSKEEKTEFEKETNLLYRQKIYKLFKTLRHVKRFIHSLQSSLTPEIAREINLQDFFILEIIKVYYPEVYKDIWENKTYYLPPWGGFNNFTMSFSIILKPEEREKLTKKHIENLLNNIHDEEQKNILLELLKTIFFVVVRNAFSNNGGINQDGMANQYRVAKRITHYECFEKYFTLQTKKDELSDFAFESNINKLIDEYKKNIDISENVEKLFDELKEKKMLVDFIDRSTVKMSDFETDFAKKFIEAIQKKSKIFSPDDVSLWRSEIGAAEHFMLKLLDNKFEQNEILDILKKILTESEDVYFITYLTFTLTAQDLGNYYPNIYQSIKNDLAILRNLMSDKLKKFFITEDKNIFTIFPDAYQWAFMLYQWSTNWREFSNKNRSIVNDYILRLFKNDITLLVKFLDGEKRKAIGMTDYGEGKKFTFHIKEMEKGHDVKKIYELAEAHKDDDVLSKTDKEILDRFIETYRQEKERDNKDNIVRNDLEIG